MASFTYSACNSLFLSVELKIQPKAATTTGIEAVENTPSLSQKSFGFELSDMESSCRGRPPVSGGQPLASAKHRVKGFITRGKIPLSGSAAKRCRMVLAIRLKDAPASSARCLGRERVRPKRGWRQAFSQDCRI